MDSFYGGKPGSPFIIKASFETVEEMKAKFCKGPAYKDVWFGEYCIIDAVSNNSYDNGKIYRRTFNYQDEAACAEYICKITGPEGGTPHFILSSIDSIQELVKTDLVVDQSAVENLVDEKGLKIENPEPDTRMYPIESGYHFDYTNEDENPDASILSLSIDNDMLVPGREIVQTSVDELGNPIFDWTDKFNDTIDYTWCSEKFSPHGKGFPGQSRVHLGFKVPFITPQFKPKTVDATDTVGITCVDYSHPFAPEYVLSIPRGSKPIKFQVEDNGEITFEYEHDPKRESGGVIPCIVGAEVREDDYHLWIGFSQPKNEGDEPRIEKTDDGKEVISYWYDYGTVKDEDGILIGHRFNTKKELDEFIPDESNGRVKTATLYKGENLPCELYAWDYDNHTWYYIGSFDGDGLPQIMVASEMNENNLKENGVCLITTVFESYGDPMNPASDSSLIDNCYWWGVGGELQ